ncbi:MAG: prepilin-type N-terminal cleavage/methylation domain-containing protein [Steroidobacter sp.]
MRSWSHIRGFTLIELMVSMVLGLVIVGGATGVILANKQSYRTNEALSQVQEGARTAFELLARDVREAGITGCDSSGRVANVLDTTSGTVWWQTWYGIAGYDGTEVDPAVAVGTSTAERVTGTDAIILQGIQGTGLSVETHDPVGASIKLNALSASIQQGDVMMVCNFDHAAMFQVSGYNSSTVTLLHRTGSLTPGNCSQGLGYPTLCSSGGNAYAFGPNSQVGRMAASAWYVGNNNRATEGGRSLYRRRMGAAAAVITEEVVAGVTNMELTYREQGVNEFRDAENVVNWANVNAVMVVLTVQSVDQRVSTDLVNDGRLERRFTNIVTLRNRVP